MRFTEARLDGLKPQAGRQVEYSDDLAPGLRIRVGGGGTKTFIFRTRLSGRQVNITLGRYPALSIAAARQRARDLMIEKEAGRLQVEQLQKGTAGQVAGRGSFHEMWDMWLQRAVIGRLKSAPEIVRRGSKYILPALGARQVSSVTRADVSRIVENVAYGNPGRERLREASVVRQIIHSFYKWALPLLDDAATNPARDALRVPAGRARDRVLSEMEIVAFWRACERYGWPFGHGFKLLLLTGQRRGEVFGASWSEISGDMWTIPALRTKNGLSHTVPLSAMALELVSGLPRFAGSDYLFPALRRAPGAETVEPRPIVNFSKTGQRLARMVEQEARELAGASGGGNVVPPWVLHDLRRTAATGMQRIGVPVEIVEAVLNHVSGVRAGVAGIYQRYDYAAEKRAALSAWPEEVKRIVSGHRSGEEV